LQADDRLRGMKNVAIVTGLFRAIDGCVLIRSDIAFTAHA